MVTGQIEGAQSRVEGHNFDARRHVVEYDDVMNKQREVIYGERRKILEGTDTHTNLLDMIDRLVASEAPTFCEGRHRETWDLEGLWDRFRQVAPLPPTEEVDLDSLGDTVEEVVEAVTNELVALYQEKEERYGSDTMRYVEQRVMLEVIDQKWRAYLTQMDHLREGVTLVGYGQKDPLMEYKGQAFEAFQELTDDIQRDIVRLLMHVQIQLQAPPQPADEPAPVAQEQVAASEDGSLDAEAEVDEDAAALAEDEETTSPPAARPAAAQASAGLARATSRVPPGAPVLAAPTSRVRNIVETSSEGTRAVSPSGGGGGTAADRHKVGRNEPCPCGSGLKYKRCHGKYE